MGQLDVTFASFWFEAYDAPPNVVPKPWAPLFEQRHNRSLLPIQFALAGEAVNAPLAARESEIRRSRQWPTATRAALARTVGMASRWLLTSVPPAPR